MSIIASVLEIETVACAKFAGRQGCKNTPRLGIWPDVIQGD